MHDSDTLKENTILSDACMGYLAEQAEKCFPHQRVALSGGKIFIKKLNVVADRKIMPPVASLIDDLYFKAVRGHAPADFNFNLVSDVFVKHIDTYLSLLSISTGKDKAWLCNMPESDALSLMIAFFCINGEFFFARIILLAFKDPAYLPVADEQDGKEIIH